MQSPKPLVVILATGGTIAGTTAGALGDGAQTTRYRVVLGVDALVAGVPALATHRIEAEDVATIDSKDMDIATWQRLAGRVAHHLAREEVAGVVVTHGTDTLEETAYFLHRLLAPSKPVVLTAAMRPASALSADGPVNLLDAVRVAEQGSADGASGSSGSSGSSGASGVSVVMAGAAWHPVGLRKMHTLRVDAFGDGDGGPIARLDGGVLRAYRPWPRGEALGLTLIERPPERWPRVEIVLNHVGADGWLVDAAVASGVQGIVVAGTGHGTQSVRLEGALARARHAGVRVRRASRCAFGPVLVRDDGDPEAAGEASAVQARVDLMLALLGEAAPEAKSAAASEHRG
jgi:L-asparaginase